MKQKSNSFFRIILNKSLVVIFATGLFVVNSYADDISSIKDKSLLLKPIKNLSDEQYDKFILGRSFFVIPWVEAPSATTARDGLGPLFNANTCVSCHPSNGRGTLYNKNMQFSRSLIAKLSLPSSSLLEHKEILKTSPLIVEPTYGGQVAINANHGVNFEAKPDIKYKEIEVKFPDGEIDRLLKPIYALKDLQYGELHKDTIITFRLAPSLNGLGYLEDISNEDILNNVDEFDKDNDGISGRANYVYSPITKKMELGRYSWKASTSSLKHQSADAAFNDMGLTTSFFPSDNCTKNQKACIEAPKARDLIDLTDERLDAISFYIKNRKTYSVKETKDYNAGLEIFKSISCAKCHINSFTTKSGVNISPFTDMLLHDMGEGLADGRSEFKANGNEWRTPPLWGLALHKSINKKSPRLLHDGRARTFQEAILWHDGEASGAKEKYMNLDKKSREKLIKFLNEV
ncbi:thiol oxidoreductase [Poseidonibacter lekithochrous]|uniref:di-heme oxidoredictase family protein n=1 Tax=Poseidonibacter TaxID=2321187 RepID=UPI001C08321E|nr:MULTISPECIES: di-heme oxidoredictase family protein [Poseidonibacter]MBU3015908.1 thiol oxidoreductase [Poseidonibacter lekithochrous]MDO6829207.1 di-heme oxidoredictase family protein [Poseidonibacter sp. 1_MG-2023]